MSASILLVEPSVSIVNIFLLHDKSNFGSKYLLTHYTVSKGGKWEYLNNVVFFKTFSLHFFSAFQF